MCPPTYDTSGTQASSLPTIFDKWTGCSGTAPGAGATVIEKYQRGGGTLNTKTFERTTVAGTTVVLPKMVFVGFDQDQQNALNTAIAALQLAIQSDPTILNAAYFENFRDSGKTIYYLCDKENLMLSQGFGGGTLQNSDRTEIVLEGGTIGTNGIRTRRFSNEQDLVGFIVNMFHEALHDDYSHAAAAWIPAEKANGQNLILANQEELYPQEVFNDDDAYHGAYVLALNALTQEKVSAAVAALGQNPSTDAVTSATQRATAEALADVNTYYFGGADKTAATADKLSNIGSATNDLNNYRLYKLYTTYVTELEARGDDGNIPRDQIDVMVRNGLIESINKSGDLDNEDNYQFTSKARSMVTKVESKQCKPQHVVSTDVVNDIWNTISGSEVFSVTVDAVRDGAFRIDTSDLLGSIGSVLGKYIAGANPIAQVLVSATMQTALTNLGNYLESYGAPGSPNSGATNMQAAALGGQLLANIEAQGVGAISSYLMGELTEALGVGGFAGDAIQSIGGQTVSHIALNLVNGNQWYAGLNPAFFVNVIGSFLGTQLANSLVHFNSTEGQLGAAVGSAYGSLNAAAFLEAIGPINPVLAVVAVIIIVFIDTVLGGWIGSWFGGTPRSGAEVSWNGKEFQVGYSWAQRGGSEETAHSLASAVVGTLDGVLSMTGSALLNPSTIRTGTYGMRKSAYVYWAPGTDSALKSDNLATYDNPDNLVTHGTYIALSDMAGQLAGGDVYVKRALATTLATCNADANKLKTGAAGAEGDFKTETLLGNISIAQDYEKYLANSEMINAVIAAEPTSAFSAGWLVTLSRAIELGLTKRASTDWIGGWNVFLDECSGGSIDGDSINPANVSLQLNSTSTERSYLFWKDGGEETGFLGDTIDTAGKTRVSGTSGADTITVGSVKGDTIANTSGLTIDGTAGNGSAKTIRVAAVIDAGDGDDTVNAGDLGNDVLGGSGNDTLVGGKLDDWQFGGDGNDRLFAGGSGTGLNTNFSDTDTAAINAALMADGGNGNYLSGDAGDDRLFGGKGSDWLAGGAGNDKLYGGAGGDILEGETGSDSEQGGDGSDQYVFNLGDGQDTVFDSSDPLATPGVGVSNLRDYVSSISSGWLQRNWLGSGGYTVDGSVAGGEDAIAFGAGISMVNLRLSRSGNDLVITFVTWDADFTTPTTTGDQLTVKDWYDTKRQVEWFRFADGEDIRVSDLLSYSVTTGTMGSDNLIGTNGNDFIFGLAGNDSIRLLSGNDFGYGGSGDDFITGDPGSDLIVGGSGNDHVLGGAGDDALSGDQGNDIVYGGEGNDVISGGKDDDTLVGGSGNDIFKIARGDGHDVVLDDYVDNWEVVWNGSYQPGYSLQNGVVTKGGVTYFDGSNWIGNYVYDTNTHVLKRFLGAVNGVISRDSGTDTIEFAPGVNLQDLKLQRFGNDLVIGVGADSNDSTPVASLADTLQLKDWFTAGPSIEKVSFAETGVFNISSWNISSAPTDSSDTITGTSVTDWITGLGGDDVIDGAAGNDILAGNEGADTLKGGAGDDILYGGAANDVLDGGVGNDQLFGGTGEDTASYASATAGVRVLLGEPGGNGGDALGDTFNSIEDVEGSYNADTLIGDDGANVLRGGGGDDTLRGGLGDDTYVYKRGDRKADILWQSDSGQAAIGYLSGTTVLSEPWVGTNQGSSWHIKGSGDFDGDGKADILWQTDDGQPGLWLMNGTTVVLGTPIGGNPGTSWHVKGSGDFDGDGKADILWQNDNGQAAIWTMNGVTQLGGSYVGGNPGTSWHIKGSGDFNGDGKADIVWQNDSGQAAIWTMNGFTQLGGAEVGSSSADWHIKSTGDFNGDSKSDILWQNDNGQAAIWLMDGFNVISGSTVGGNPGTSWHVIGTGDFNSDGKSDILWQNDNGQADIWLMDGISLVSGALIDVNPGSSWHAIGAGNFNSDGSDTINEVGTAGTDQILASDGSLNTALYSASWQVIGTQYLYGTSPPVLLFSYRLTVTKNATGEVVYRSRDNIDFRYTSSSAIQLPSGTAWPFSDGQWLLGAHRTGSGVQTVLTKDGTGGGDDSLLLEDVALGDLTANYSGADLVLTIAGGGQITVKSQTSAATSVESLTLSDGLVASLASVQGPGAGGTGNADLFLGDGNANSYNGGAGNDVISGGAGNDTLIGGDGDDVVEGGVGGDNLDGGAGTDTIRYAGSAAAVMVNLQARSAYGGDAQGDVIQAGTDGYASFENIIGSNVGYDTLTGDDRNNRLAGLGGDDVLSGLGGDDVLVGGSGNDTLYGGNGADDLAGEAGNDFLQGDAGNDILDGGAGDDTLYGNDGDDTLVGGDGTDILYGGTGNDQLSAGSGADTLYGDDGNDTVIGEDGNDTLYGGAGNDTLSGGAGEDHLEGGSGDDTYVFDALSGTDTILDSNGQNKIAISGVTASQLWLTRSGNDLVIGVIGGAATIRVQGCYASGTLSGLYSVSIGDHELVLSTAAPLIAAMSAYGLSTPGTMPASLSDMVASYWGTGSGSSSGTGDGGQTGTTETNTAPSLSSGSFNVGERSPGGGQTRIATIAATDADTQAENRNFYYALTNDAGGMFSINSATGELMLQGVLNYQICSSYNVQVQVWDGGAPNSGLSASASYSVNVAYQNAAPDSLIVSFQRTFQITTYPYYTINLWTVVGHDPDGDAVLLNGSSSLTIGGPIGQTSTQTVTATDSRGASKVFNVTYNSSGYVTYPIALDLDGSGLDLVSANSVSAPWFDMNGDGYRDRTGWVGPNDGILAIDRDGDGVITKGEEISFSADVNDAVSDLEGLRAYDTNQNGVIDAGDDQFSDLRVWQDANQNGICEQGELTTLADRSIAAINLTMTPTGNIQDSNTTDNVLYATSQFVRTDGSIGTVGDVGLYYQSNDMVVNFGAGDQHFHIDPSTIEVVSDPKAAADLLNQLGPIVLDLDGNGVSLQSKALSSVRFDMDDSGVRQKTGWVGPGDGLLVLDRNGDGKITEGSEISFKADLAGAVSDLEGLTAYDTNQNGLFDAGDAQFAQFEVWRDSNQNGVSDAGELKSLADYGIVGINLTRTPTGESPNGATDNVVYATADVVHTDGSITAAGDVFLAYDDDPAPAKVLSTAERTALLTHAKQATGDMHSLFDDPRAVVRAPNEYGDVPDVASGDSGSFNAEPAGDSKAPGEDVFDVKVASDHAAGAQSALDSGLGIVNRSVLQMVSAMSTFNSTAPGQLDINGRKHRPEGTEYLTALPDLHRGNSLQAA